MELFISVRRKMKNKLLLRTAILGYLVLGNAGHGLAETSNDIFVCIDKFDGDCRKLVDPRDPCKLPDGLLSSIERDLSVIAQGELAFDSAVELSDPENRVDEIKDYIKNLDSLNSESFVKDELQRFIDILEGKVKGEGFKGKYESVNNFLKDLVLKDESGEWLDADNVALGEDYCKPLLEGLSNCNLDFPWEGDLEKVGNDMMVAYANLYYDKDAKDADGLPLWKPDADGNAACDGSVIVRDSIWNSSCCKAVLSDKCFECPEISVAPSWQSGSKDAINCVYAPSSVPSTGGIETESTNYSPELIQKGGCDYKACAQPKPKYADYGVNRQDWLVCKGEKAHCGKSRKVENVIPVIGAERSYDCLDKTDKCDTLYSLNELGTSGDPSCVYTYPMPTPIPTATPVPPPPSTPTTYTASTGGGTSKPSTTRTCNNYRVSCRTNPPNTSLCSLSCASGYSLRNRRNNWMTFSTGMPYSTSEADCICN